MDGLRRSHQNSFLIVDSVNKAEGGLADVAYRDADYDAVSDKQGGFVVGFGMNDGQKVGAVVKHGRETEAQFLQQLLVGVVDDGKLMGKKENARGIGIVEADLGFIGEHGGLS